MNRQFQHKSKLSFTFGAAIVSLLALLLCSVPAMADQGEGGCKGLKPYNTLDELLYQFYSNLDSDCLFEMSTAELEEAWGIKILDEERFKPKNYYPLSETEFYYKPYKSEKDAFYLELTPRNSSQYGGKTFTIRATEEYFEKYGTLFPDENLPASLPEPTDYKHAESQPQHQSCAFPDITKITTRHNGTFYETCYSPTWEMPFAKITLRAYGKITITQTRSKRKEPEKPSGDALVTVAENDRSTPCRGLRPYKDLDDLLYQFYINLDSDCLFTMPLKELEKVWDTEIGGCDREGCGLALENQPCNAERAAFTIRTTRRYRYPGSQFFFDTFVIGRADGCPTGTSLWGRKERKGDGLKMLPPLNDVPGAWRGLYSSDKVGKIGFMWSPFPNEGGVIYIEVSRLPREQVELE